jgi:hypothetical protein
MRVVVFTDNDFDKVNGVTTTWRAVLRAADASRTVRIFTASDGEADLPDYFAAASFGIGLPWYRDMRVYLPRLRRFARQLREDGATVVHVATPGPVGLAGRWLARRAGLPLVGSYHTQLGDYVAQFSRSPRLGRSFDAFMRWFYAPCASLLVPSQATVDQLRDQGYRPAQLRIWPRGVARPAPRVARRRAAARHPLCRSAVVGEGACHCRRRPTAPASPRGRAPLHLRGRRPDAAAAGTAGA